LRSDRIVLPAGARTADPLATAAIDSLATTATIEPRPPGRPVRLELRHLRYFVAVAEELSFTRAAERLHIAQPPLSTQVRQLEEELGAQLFVRDKRRVYLTQPGREMLERARAILAATAEAKEAVRRTACGETGELRLGYVTSAMFTEVLPGVIRRFQKRYPRIQLHLHEVPSVDQLYALHNRELDVGILRRPDMSIPSGVRMEEWYQAPLVAALPKAHRLAARDSLRIADLKDEPLILFPRQSGIGLYWRVVDLCIKAKFRPRIARETRDYAVMIGLVSAGVGIALVPSDTQCIRLAGVTYRPVHGKDAVSAIQIAYRPDHGDEHVTKMLEELRAVHG
jgi:DNA-binding transcriptional LysR family regulator